MDIWGILEYTASATVVALLIWLVKLIFHDKLDARWHYFVWLVLLVRLLVPVQVRIIPASLSVFQEIPVGKWLEMARILAEKRGHGQLMELLFRVYLWGAAVLGSFYLIIWAILRVQVAMAPAADEDTKKSVDEIAGRYGLKSCRDIRVGKSATPYICGLLHPVLVVPQDMRIEETVIVHELMHKRYRDVLVNIGLHVVRVANWFNPVIWMVTAVVQNDSEALCDQRVLECCGQERAREYGELLIAMGEGRHGLIKVGTSNMAGTYRNMKTRIRRIREFRRVPERIGLVTCCITLMLAIAGIGSSAREADGFQIPQIDSVKDLEWALLEARCYHARTPEEAMYLFLRSYEERSTIYRIAVMPEEEIPQYEEFAEKWFENRDVTLWSELSSDEGERYPSYFPQETACMADYRVYNLLCDEQKGSAVVCAIPNGRQGEAFAEWRLKLTNEDGWKVWLEEESGMRTGEYRPEPLLAGNTLLGDFLVEQSGYNEGVYNQLGMSATGFVYWEHESENEKTESYPQFFSTEYRHRLVSVTYLGEESLEGKTVKVILTSCDDGEIDASLTQQDFREIEDADAGLIHQYLQEMAGETLPSKEGEDESTEDAVPSAGNMEISDYGSYTYSGDNGNGMVVFDGTELMSGEPRMVYGTGVGYSQKGYCWRADDRIGTYVRIYMDDVLIQEGEVWSGNP